MFLKSLTLSNILSFGPEPHTVELGPLNVIIGPNGSGKSNFIEAIGLLKAAPTDIREPIRQGGGVGEWIWKGVDKSARATIESDFQLMTNGIKVRYQVVFCDTASHFSLVREKFLIEFPDTESANDFSFTVENEEISITDAEKGGVITGYDHKKSSLSQIQKLLRFAQGSADIEAETFLDWMSRTRIYTDISVQRDSPARLPQKADLPNIYLASDLSNLGLILNRIKRDAATRQNLKATVQEIYGDIDDVDVQVEGGTVQVFAYEGLRAVPATRLSSGTLRFLCLLAILLHPEPPPLICLEEPELGLHPDLIPTISRLLKEASERTQLIVTTHSDILVDTMTDRPEAVLVAEKGEGGTRLTRLDPEQLKPWLEGYRLGQLWTRGDIGGTRW